MGFLSRRGFNRETTAIQNLAFLCAIRHTLEIVHYMAGDFFKSMRGIMQFRCLFNIALSYTKFLADGLIICSNMRRGNDKTLARDEKAERKRMTKALQGPILNHPSTKRTP
jgi:hypothetical protein